MKTKKAKIKSAKQPVGIKIGADSGSVDAASKAVMEILYCPAGSAEKIAALESLGRICSVNNSTISHCSIQM